ncbi:hypothetical protein EY528_003207 [Escherichia coli]|nr:hypothetical protein [Escherichia coli]EES5680313.1 hypothetical protein [Escherichia coli]
MKHADVISQSIRDYSVKYNKDNSKRINFIWWSIPSTIAFAVFVYYRFHIDVYLLIMLVFIVGAFALTARQSKQLGLLRLESEYANFLTKGTTDHNTVWVRSVVPDEFLSNFADNQNIPVFIKKELAERMRLNHGRVFWSDILDVRRMLILVDQENEAMKNDGARKLNKYSANYSEDNKDNV